MMSVEGPLLAALIARLSDPKFNLAAYGVAFSFAMIVESPIIMIMSASTALAKDRLSLQRLRRFSFILNGLVTSFMLLLLIPGLFDWVMQGVIGLPAEVSSLVYTSLACLLPWPASIGYRRFYQGILIRADLTRLVALGTVVRLFAMAGTAFLLFTWSDLQGAHLGALALSSGVVVEAVAIRVMAHKAVKEVLRCEPRSRVPGYWEIAKFYYPLALTSMMGLATQPMVTLFLGKSRMAIESLAVLPVVTALVFIFRSLGLAFQEVGIALIGEDFEGYRELRKFALILMLLTAGGLSLMAFTPLSSLWFASVSGLSAELTSLARWTTSILAISPSLTVLLCFQRAMAINLRKTHLVTIATGLEVSTILLMLALLIQGAEWIGAIAAASAMLAGRICSNSYLGFMLGSKLSKRSSVAASQPSLGLRLRRLFGLR